MQRDDPGERGPRDTPGPADRPSATAPQPAAQAGRPEEQGPDQATMNALRRDRRGRVAKVVVALAVAVMLILFILSNSHEAKVSFVFFTRHPPLIWVMFACAVLGGIFGYLIGRPGTQIRRRPKEDRAGERRGGRR